MLKRWLEHPLTRGLAVDAPATTNLRRQIIAGKPFLRRIYEDWYAGIAGRVPAGAGRVVELGSGAGFLRELIPDVIRSEIMQCDGVEVVFDACSLPFQRDSLRAIVMTDVLHHVPDVRAFFREAAMAVRPGGAIVMIEPWVSGWSRFVYSQFHHEPFAPDAANWEFASSGPLSGANGALPWIVFERDRLVFEREFPEWRIDEVQLMMPLRYLVSGGVSMRSLMPGWSYSAWRAAEAAMSPVMRHVAMFACVVLTRTGRSER